MLEIHHAQETPQLLSQVRERIYMSRYRAVRQQWHTDPSDENRRKGLAAAEHYYTSNIDHIGALQIISTPLNTDDAQAYRAHEAFIDLEHLSHSLNRPLGEWVASETMRSISQVISLANKGSKHAATLYSSYLSSSSAYIRDLGIKNLGELSLPAEIRVLQRHAANQEQFFGQSIEPEQRLRWQTEFGQYSVDDLTRLVTVLNANIERQYGDFLGLMLSDMQTPFHILNPKAGFKSLLDEFASWKNSSMPATSKLGRLVLARASGILGELRKDIETIFKNYEEHAQITNSPNPEEAFELYRNGRIYEISRALHLASQ